MSVPRIAHRAFALMLLLPVAASAQQEPDFEIGESEPPSVWSPFVELLLRADRVSGLPGGREDLERLRARARVGAQRDLSDRWSFGLGAVAGLGSDDNRDNVINNDVSGSDMLRLDQAWLRWRGGDSGHALLGKTALPLELSPMLWDDDLRPLGLSGRIGGSFGDFDRWQLDLGAFAPDPLRHDGSRLDAVQLGLHWREGAPFSSGVLLAWLDFSQADTLARNGLGRGNRLRAGGYAGDFRLLDVQLYARWRLSAHALELRVDRVRNLDAADDDDGTRASLVYGDRRREAGWEFGWSWERIQRDAVLAAVNSDDWWFHTAMRGHMPWVGYGFGGAWSVRLAAFLETRDGTGDETERLLLDVEARW